jgi:hypothetical protein
MEEEIKALDSITSKAFLRNKAYANLAADMDFDGWFNIVELEDDWRASQEREEIEEQNDLWDIYPDAKNYLAGRLRSFKQKTNDFKKIVHRDLVEAYKTNSNYLEIFRSIWCDLIIEKANKEIAKMEQMLEEKEEVKEPRALTQKEINYARNVDIKRVIGTDKDFVNCPYHIELNASFYLKGKFGYCFGCGARCDSIKYLQDFKNMDFQEAVKYLQNY